jgi:hypothetical protein
VSQELWPNVEGEHDEEVNEGWEDVLNQNIKKKKIKGRGENSWHRDHQAGG